MNVRTSSAPWLAAALAVGLAVSAAHARDLASARAFVTRLYAHYPVASHTPAYDPQADAVEAELFDASLLRLMQEDRRLAGDEVPTLDGDPVCDCQDDDGMTFTLGPVRRTAAGALATITRRGPDKEKPETIILDLVSTTAGWRIHDIMTPGDPSNPSLRKLLIDGIRGWRKQQPRR